MEDVHTDIFGVDAEISLVCKFKISSRSAMTSYLLEALDINLKIDSACTFRFFLRSAMAASLPETFKRSSEMVELFSDKAKLLFF